MKNFEAVIFDMDGVLVDTLPFHYKAWHKMFTEAGYYFDYDLFKEKIDARPRLQGAAEIAKDASKEQWIEMAEKKQQYFLDLMKEEGVFVFEDALALLQYFRQQGLKTAVASSSKNAALVLEHAKLYDLFDVIVSGGDIQRGKPDPEIFLTAAALLGVKPEKCLAIEDSMPGVQAAVGAKMFTVAVARENNEEDLKEASIVLTNLEDLTKQKVENLVR